LHNLPPFQAFLRPPLLSTLQPAATIPESLRPRIVLGGDNVTSGLGKLFAHNQCAGASGHCIHAGQCGRSRCSRTERLRTGDVLRGRRRRWISVLDVLESGDLDASSRHGDRKWCVGHLSFREPTPIAGAFVPALPGTNNGGSAAPLFAGYASYQLNPNMWLGMSINAPFGLSENFPDAWAGRNYAASGALLASYNAAPSIAYRINDWISIGVGAQIQYAKANFSFGLPTAPFAPFPLGSEVTLRAPDGPMVPPLVLLSRRPRRLQSELVGVRLSIKKLKASWFQTLGCQPLHSAPSTPRSNYLTSYHLASVSA
jgi:hypothetical protein